MTRPMRKDLWVLSIFTSLLHIDNSFGATAINEAVCSYEYTTTTLDSGIGFSTSNPWLVSSNSDGKSIFVSEINPRTVAGTNTQTWLSTNNGNTWLDKTQVNIEFIISETISGDGQHLFIHANSSISVNNNKLFIISSDAGVSWITLPIAFSISSLASSYDASVIVASGYGAGNSILSYLYTSTDKGRSWSNSSFSTGLYSRPISGGSTVAISSDGFTIYGVSGSPISPSSIYISTNRGISWRQTGAPTLLWTSVAASRDGVTVAAAGSELPLADTTVVYVSSDSGSSWTLSLRLPTASSAAVRLTSSASIGPLILWTSAPSRIYFSTDKGSSWLFTDSGINSPSSSRYLMSSSSPANAIDKVLALSVDTSITSSQLIRLYSVYLSNCSLATTAPSANKDDETLAPDAVIGIGVGAGIVGIIAIAITVYASVSGSLCFASALAHYMSLRHLEETARMAFKVAKLSRTVYNEITFEASYKAFAVVQFSGALRAERSKEILSEDGIQTLCAKLEARLKMGDEPAMCKFTFEVILLALKIRERFDAGLLQEGSAYVASALSETVSEMLTALNSDSPIGEDDLSLEGVKCLSLEDFNRGLKAHKYATLGSLALNAYDLVSGAMQNSS